MSDSLAGKRVLILGFGRQGKALARWLPTLGAEVTVSDKRDAGAMADDLLDFLGEPVAFALGGHPLELLAETDVVCVSGGVPIDLPIVQAALQAHLPVTNDAILFLERCPALVIGITGSAGKTTTTTLVGEMCKAEGRTTWVGGNIGNVLLEDLADIGREDTVVMELSSFQLEISPLSPDVAAILNVTPNHLDRHGTLQRYAEAKAQIMLHQAGDDLAVFGADDLIAHSLSARAPARSAFFSLRQMVADGAFLLGDRLMVSGACSPTGTPKVVCDRADIRLRGEHNVLNILAACALAGAVGVNLEAMQATIRNFRGVAHRLEWVTEQGGVAWFNDSIATAPERVIAALRSFDEPLVLLLGGRDKKLPWGELASMAVERCRAVITFGEHGEAIAETMKRAKSAAGGRGLLSQVVRVQTLDEAVDAAHKVARAGDVVLLSPGCTSYDAYEDFAERGEHFRVLVKALRPRSTAS